MSAVRVLFAAGTAALVARAFTAGTTHAQAWP
jgi:hypothetical protein